MAICPHCGDTIEYLDYQCNTYGTEYGTYTGSDWEYGESDTDDTDNYRYKCPDCSEELFSNTMDAEEFFSESTEKVVKESKLISSDF